MALDINELGESKYELTEGDLTMVVDASEAEIQVYVNRGKSCIELESCIWSVCLYVVFLKNKVIIRRKSLFLQPNTNHHFYDHTYQIFFLGRIGLVIHGQYTGSDSL